MLFYESIKYFLDIVLQKNIEHIKARIREAALESGRKPSGVRLVAAAKTMSVGIVREAIENGVEIIGENYIQEARQKHDALRDMPVSWHFIGHLQSNKAKYAARIFNLIHSVDSVKLAKELDKHAKKLGKRQKILLQTNIAGEASKSGISPKNLPAVVKEISRLKNISVKGLMTMPPFFDNPDKARPFFSALSNLGNQIAAKKMPGVSMEELSMGMTGDFEAAIQEGSTLVRIGTAIFGARK